MKINILIVYEDSLDVSQLECPEYYNYICVQKSAFKQNSYKLFSLLWRKHNIKIFYTIGGPMKEWMDDFGFFPYNVRKKWIHLQKVEDFDASSIPYCLISASRTQDQPLISVMTTTFHSGEKLKRPLESLNLQTYNNWEWVIWDDSKDDQTWKELQKLALTDMRIRIYKAPHNGFIGEVKRRAGAFCQGRWLVELDHDDHISTDLFETILKIDQKYPKAGFIYSDFFMLSEDGEMPQTFGHMPAFGYGAYFKEYCRGKFHNVYYAQSMNPVTASHIVGVPNHVRIWKRSVYEEVGKHNEDLPVVDDYELLLRTFLHDCDWVRIPKPCYAQYNNSGGNNFTYIRNKLIQHLSHYTWRIYHEDVNAKFVELDYPAMDYPETPFWMNPKPDSTPYEQVYYTEEISVILSVPLKASIVQIKECLAQIYQQKVPFVLFAVGHPHSNLEKAIYSWIHQHADTLSNLRYWNFINASGQIYGPKELWKKKKPYLHLLKNYALKVGVRTKWVTYVTPDEKWSEDHLQTLLNKVGDDKYYLNSNNFIHQTELCRKHGYWHEHETAAELIHKFKL